MSRGILAYVAVFLAVLGLASTLLYLRMRPQRFDVSPASGLPGKTAFYLAHSAEYDLVFLGDSRTYCAMQPELLDPLLGTRSLNLSHWAHWLPTLYPQAADLAPRIPAGTTVVLSLGEQNFTRLPIHDKYPIGLKNLPRYLSFGVSLAEMTDNLAAFNPLFYLYAKRGALMDRVRALATRTLWGAKSQTQAGPAEFEMARLEREALAQPGVLGVEVQAPQGVPVAVSKFMRGGGYLLEELDLAHFRARQKRDEGAAAFAPAAGVSPDPSRWALFLATLEMFREHGVHLVVNVLEEAPFRYPNPEWRLAVRAFMDGPVRREVEARGFVFLRTDLDRLTDADYFDYDHLNACGAKTFSQLFAEALRPQLSKAGRP